LFSRGRLSECPQSGSQTHLPGGKISCTHT
jgi:hypothetical protein